MSKQGSDRHRPACLRRPTRKHLYPEQGRASEPRASQDERGAQRLVKAPTKAPQTRPPLFLGPFLLPGAERTRIWHWHLVCGTQIPMWHRVYDILAPPIDWLFQMRLIRANRRCVWGGGGERSACSVLHFYLYSDILFVAAFALIR